MAVTTQVRVHDGTSWQTVANVSDIRPRRRTGAGDASFRVSDATITQRDLLRTGRECEITVTVDGRSKVFGGFVDRPRIQVEAPGHFNIFPRIVDLSHGAAWHAISSLSAPAGEKYTETIKRFWLAHWNEVDRTSGGVVDDPATHTEEYRPGYDTLASMTNEIIQRYLPGWVWWVGHDGAGSGGIDKKLFVQPRGHNDRTGSVKITEDDIGYRFTVQPTVDPRNLIIVVGDDDPDTDADRPVTVRSRDSNSETAYGQRDLVVKDSEAVDTTDLRRVGVSTLEQRKFDQWQGRFEIDDWSLEPGDKVSMYLPTIGVNNGPNAVPWILMEVEEQVNRGAARRWGTFIEHNDAAYFRVT